MITVDLRNVDWGTLERVFPPEISANAWIGFHGTSSVCEANIDSDGLKWTPSLGSRDELQAIADTYGTIDWCGVCGGGLPVLKSFTLQGDFGGSKAKPIFIGETAERCTTFASRDFAGGETARAVRYALGDLKEFLGEPGVRKQWRDYRWRNLLERVGMDYPEWVRRVRPEDATDDQTVQLANIQRKAGVPGVGEPWREDLVWLASELERHTATLSKCQAVYDAHAYGVVYAIQFSPSSLADLEYRDCMGIATHVPISPTQFVAKALIPGNAQPLRRIANDFMELISKDGLVARLRRCKTRR